MPLLSRHFGASGSASLMAFVAAAAAMPCAAHPAAQARARFLMGTTCLVQAHAHDAVPAEAALDAIARVEDRLSTWRSDTPLSRFNQTAGGPPVAIDSRTLAFLADCASWSERTGGAFDAVVGSLVDAWDLRGEGRVPSPRALRGARALSGHRLLAVDGARGMARLRRKGAWVDSGGIAKGHALDEAAGILRGLGVEDALIDLGGQVLALGADLESGGAGWAVALADPRDRLRPALTLRLSGLSVATSAQSERGLQAPGRLIGHVLDPRTGRPVETDASASAVARSARDADALSTALLVMGPDAGLAWIARHPGFDAGYLIPLGDGRLELRASPGFLALITSSAPDLVRR